MQQRSLPPAVAELVLVRRMSTFEEQRAFLRDLDYVFKQAAAFHEFYSSGADKCVSRHPMFWTIHNALLESSLSFLRKANEFFGGNRDIAASDFLPSIGKSWLFTKDDSTLLNDRVMHLSLEEAKNSKMDWAAFLERNVPEAQKRYSAFIAELQRECPGYFCQPTNDPKTLGP